MNILLLNRFDIYSLPGTVRMVNLSEQFVKKGHSVTLAYYPSEERRALLPLLRTSDPEGVTTLLLNSNKRKLGDNIRRLRQSARQSDIICFQKCFPETALLALWLSYLEQKPLHYDWDDNETAIVPEWTQSGVIHHIVKHFEDNLPKMVDSLSYSTEFVRDLAIQRGGDSKAMISAPVGADIQQFKPSNDGTEIRQLYGNPSRLVLYSGQLEGGSYAELLLEAAKIIIPLSPGVKFLVVGGGNKLSLLKQQAESLGISNSVVFTDYVLHSQIPSYLAAADICVACFEDNLITKCKSPLKIAEYLAAGKAIVASGAGDVHKMVQDAGVIVPPGDSKALAEGILKLLQNPDGLEVMKQNAWKKAESEYNWSVIADRFLMIFQKDLDKYAPGNGK